MTDQIDTTQNGNDDTKPDTSTDDVTTPDPILKPDGDDKADHKKTGDDAQTPDDPEKKADGDKDGDDGDDKKKEPEGAPEKYEPFKIEGADMTDDAQTAIETLAREFNLPQDQALKIAQAYFDFNSKQVADNTAAQGESIKQHAIDQVDTLKKEWGPDFEKKSMIASKAMNQYATKEEMEYIVKSGFAHDAVIAKIFHKVGLKISEDSIEDGTSATGEETFNTYADIFPQPPVQNATDG